MTDKELDERLTRIEQYLLIGAKTVYTIAEASMITGLSKSRIYTLVAEKKIPHYKNGKLYFKRKELEDWMTNHRITTQEEIDSKAEIYARSHPMPVV